MSIQIQCDCEGCEEAEYIVTEQLKLLMEDKLPGWHDDGGDDTCEECFVAREPTATTEEEV